MVKKINKMVASFSHCPVMLKQCLQALQASSDKKYIDCNLGAGGHSEGILKTGGMVLGIDADEKALLQAKIRLAFFKDKTVFINDNFVNLYQIAVQKGFDQADGILFDLGLSSMQLDEGSGGFSFKVEAKLDMRYGSSSGEQTAEHIINTYSQSELADILYKYGDEPRAKVIAKAIVMQRPFYSTVQLAKVIAQASCYRGGKIHPATRSFQALRIYVNNELENLYVALTAAVKLLKQGGRLTVLSYHSLEDRVVKQVMAYESAACICPSELPVCTCNKIKTVKVLPKVLPDEQEIKANPRSRSAKLRVCEKLV